MWLGFSNASMTKIIDYMIKNEEAFKKMENQFEGLYNGKLYDKIFKYKANPRRHCKRNDESTKEWKKQEKSLKALNILTLKSIFGAGTNPLISLERRIKSLAIEAKNVNKFDDLLKEASQIHYPDWEKHLEEVNRVKSIQQALGLVKEGEIDRGISLFQKIKKGSDKDDAIIESIGILTKNKKLSSINELLEISFFKEILSMFTIRNLLETHLPIGENQTLVNYLIELKEIKLAQKFMYI